MGKANIATAKLWRLPSATARGPCLGSAAAPGLSPDTGGFPQGRLSGVPLQAVNRRSRCSSELGLGFLNYRKGKYRYREGWHLNRGRPQAGWGGQWPGIGQFCVGGAKGPGGVPECPKLVTFRLAAL